ncbi:MAG: RimK/LysX family protein [Bacteroidota bacterium]
MKKVIGRRDKIDLPELGLLNIDAKIDTGAYGSALHCHHIEVVKIKDQHVLTFKLLDPSHPEYNDKVFTFESYGDRIVKSSSGQSEHRYTIKTQIKVFKKKYTVEFSLTDRGGMKYPILLGRKFLNKRYIVDVHFKDISYEMKQQEI